MKREGSFIWSKERASDPFTWVNYTKTSFNSILFHYNPYSTVIAILLYNNPYKQKVPT